MQQMTRLATLSFVEFVANHLLNSCDKNLPWVQTVVIGVIQQIGDASTLVRLCEIAVCSFQNTSDFAAQFAIKKPPCDETF